MKSEALYLLRTPNLYDDAGGGGGDDNDVAAQDNQVSKANRHKIPGTI